MGTTINERFEELIKVLYGGNKRAFATAVGVSATVIENVVGTRRGKPSYDVLEKIYASANIDANWLLSGEGEMQRSNSYPNESYFANLIREKDAKIEELTARAVRAETLLDAEHDKRDSYCLAGSSKAADYKETYKP